MKSSLTRVVRRSVRAGQNIVSQVVVSVAAAVCVGLITNAYLEEKPASAPAAVQATEQAAADAGAAETATDASRIIVADPSEAAYEDRAPSRPLGPTSVQSPIRNVAEAPMPAMPSPVPKMQATALPPLDSQIVADLPVRDVDQAGQGAEIFPGVPAENTLAESLRNATPVAEQKPERRRFLGLPLPYFVPTASSLVESASAAGGRIISVVEGR